MGISLPSSLVHLIDPRVPDVSPTSYSHVPVVQIHEHCSNSHVCPQRAGGSLLFASIFFFYADTLRSLSMLNLPCDNKANICLLGIIYKCTYFLIFSRLCSVDARLAHLALFVWQYLLKKLLHVPWSFPSPWITEYFIALVSFLPVNLPAVLLSFYLLFVCVCVVCVVWY